MLGYHPQISAGSSLHTHTHTLPLPPSSTAVGDVVVVASHRSNTATTAAVPLSEPCTEEQQQLFLDFATLPSSSGVQQYLRVLVTHLEDGLVCWGRDYRSAHCRRHTPHPSKVFVGSVFSFQFSHVQKSREPRARARFIGVGGGTFRGARSQQQQSSSCDKPSAVLGLAQESALTGPRGQTASDRCCFRADGKTLVLSVQTYQPNQPWTEPLLTAVL